MTLHPPPPPLDAPEGTRDLLFEGARRLRACESALARTFDATGFAEVIPPAIERAELFDGLPALRASDLTGRALAVRADFTSQVARIAATRLPDRTPLRLWYRGPVVRDVPPGRITPRERWQCGVEVIGDPSVEADVELLTVASRALDALGVSAQEGRIVVGSTAYFAAVLERAGVNGAQAAALRDAIDRKDRARTAALASELEPGAARDALVFLASPESQQTVLETARRLAPDTDAAQAIERLERIVEGARSLGERVEIDLGEVRGIGYYTGLVFNVYVAGAPGPVGGGGRYDRLLARFGDPRAAVGFSLDLDALAPLARPQGEA